MTFFKQMNEVDEDNKITIDFFKEYINIGRITKFDGYGYYATNNKLSDTLVDFSDIENNSYPSWVTHVCWYEK